jgi:hypothetical protein
MLFLRLAAIIICEEHAKFVTFAIVEMATAVH